MIVAAVGVKRTSPVCRVAGLDVSVGVSGHASFAPAPLRPRRRLPHPWPYRWGIDWPTRKGSARA
jgi:hypothetical protein